MIDCRVMGHWLCQTGDSIAVHHPLSGPPNTESSTLPAPLSDHFVSPEDPFFTGVSMEINSVSDADSHSYDHLFHGSAAEACRNAVSPPQATGSTLR